VQYLLKGNTLGPNNKTQEGNEMIKTLPSRGRWTRQSVERGQSKPQRFSMEFMVSGHSFHTREIFRSALKIKSRNFRLLLLGSGDNLSSLQTANRRKIQCKTTHPLLFCRRPKRTVRTKDILPNFEKGTFLYTSTSQ
jgi:hypothetical protein